MACSAAKTRCSFETPCVRCTKRKIDCVYEQTTTARRVSPRSAAVTDAKRSEPHKQHRTSPADRTSHAYDEFLPFGDFTSPDDLGLGDAQTCAHSHDMGQPTYVAAQRSSTIEPLTFDELLAFEDDISPQHQCWAGLSLAPQDNLDLKSPHWCAWMRGNISLALVTETSSVLPTSNVLSVPNCNRSHAQHTADLIIQSLRSFPTMMTRRETFPWFIHPQLAESRVACVSEALSSCMSIAQLFASRTYETRTFLRRTMAAEHRRIKTEVRCLLEACSSEADCQIDVPHVQDRTPRRNASLHDLFDHLYHRVLA